MTTQLQRFVFAILMAATLTLISVGCKHTAHGVGEDMEEAGEKIQEKTKSP